MWPSRENRLLKFELIEPLGHGAQGSVSRVRDLLTGEEYALKRLRIPRRDAGHGRPLESVLREIEVLRSIAHPNLVRLLDWGLYDADTIGDDPNHDEIHLVYAYVPGTSLAKALPRTDPGSVHAPYLISQLASALDALHLRGVVHRDIKPSNVVIEIERDGWRRPTPVLIDLGSALTPNATPSAVLSNVGSLGFCAPEVRKEPRAATALSDQWSLARVALEAYRRECGACVPEALTDYDEHDLLTWLERRRRRVARVLRRALSHHPRERFPSVLEFARELNEATWSGPNKSLQQWLRDCNYPFQDLRDERLRSLPELISANLVGFRVRIVRRERNALVYAAANFRDDAPKIGLCRDRAGHVWCTVQAFSSAGVFALTEAAAEGMDYLYPAIGAVAPAIGIAAFRGRSPGMDRLAPKLRALPPSSSQDWLAEWLIDFLGKDRGVSVVLARTLPLEARELRSLSDHDVRPIADMIQLWSALVRCLRDIYDPKSPLNS